MGTKGIGGDDRGILTNKKTLSLAKNLQDKDFTPNIYVVRLLVDF